LVYLKDKALSGIYWNGLAQFVQEGLGLLTTLILARLLSPDAFGLLAMVAVFVGFISIFQNLGLGSSIVQEQEFGQENLSSIFWLNLLFSLFLFLLTLLIAPLISSFYGEPSIRSLMMVLAIKFPLGSVGMVHGALLAKQMMFKKLALIKNVSVAMGSAVGIAFALTGFGVWALVWQALAHSLANAILYWIMVPWSPKCVLSYKKIKKHLDFGLNLQAGTILNYCARNADDLIVGRFVGAGALGIYQMAYRLMLWPLQKVSRVVGEVMFPALSSIQNDKELVKRIFIKATRSIALVTFPMVLGIWVTAPTIIHVLLGEKWAGVIPIFQVLCILGLFQSIATNTGWIFLSQGKADIRLKLQIVFSTLFIISFLLGVRWGAMGVAVCYTVASLLATPIQFQVAGRLIGLTFMDIVRATTGILLCAAIMAFLVLGLGHILPSHWPRSLHLILQIFFGVTFYFAIIHIKKLRAYMELKEVLHQRWENHTGMR
jgi:O-antigen/teichoic acid export membrane protein